VPVRIELLAQVTDDGSRMFGAMTRQLAGLAQQVTGLGRGLPEPRRLLEAAMQRSDDWGERLAPAMARLVAGRRQAVGEAAAQLVRPGDYVARKRQDLDVVLQRGERLPRLGQAIFRTRAQYLENVGKLLESYSYKGVLERGFVVVRDGAGAPVTAAGMLSPGDDISLAFKEDGRAEAVVSSVGAGGGAPPGTSTTTKKPKTKRKSPPDDSQGSLL